MAKTLRQTTSVGFTTKNSPLTNSEVDINFIEIVDDILGERTAVATLTNKTLTGAVLNGTLGAITRSTVAATTISATGAITGSNLSGTNTGDQSTITGNAATATTLATARTIGLSGVTATATSFNGSANILIPVTAVPTTLLTGAVADANISGSYTGIVNLTGSGSVDFNKFLGLATDLVTTPSYTWTGDTTTGFYRPTTSQIGVAVGGVQRGLFTTTGLTVTGSIGATNLSGTNTGDQSSVSGNAGSVTNGVYTVGDQTIGGTKTFSSFNYAPAYQARSTANPGFEMHIPGVTACFMYLTTSGQLRFENSNGVFGASGLRFSSDANGNLFTNGSLTGNNLSATGNTTGNAATVTNGVYIVGDQAMSGRKISTGGFEVAREAVSTDPYGPISVTRGTASNFSYYGMTRSGAVGWGTGIDTNNRMIFGGGANGPNFIFASTSAALDMSGNFTATGNITAFSDIRLKTDITKIADALDKVNQLNGYTYTRTDTGERQTGVIAQELQKVLPEAVMSDGETLSVAYGNMMGIMIEAVKELTARIKVLEAR